MIDINIRNRNTEISYERKKSIHVPPHLHDAIEMVFVIEGSVELGVGKDLYHLEKGDFGIVFPNVIHHYQVFGMWKKQSNLFVSQTLHFFIPILKNCRATVRESRL